MYARTLRKDDRTRRFSISTAGASGWEVLDQADEQIVRRVFYSDWHRVERARLAFVSEAFELQNAGWLEP